MKPFFKFVSQQPGTTTAGLVTLYLEINDTFIAGAYQHAGQPPLSDLRWVILPLPPRTIIKGIIFKPASLHHVLSSFLIDHTLTQPHTVVSFPALAATAKPFRNFILLSLTLALKKVPLSLTKVVACPLTGTQGSVTTPATGTEGTLPRLTALTTPDLDATPDELASFRQPAGSSPTTWLTGSLFLFVTLVVTAVTLQVRMHRRIAEQERQVNQTRIIVTKHQDKIHTLTILAKKTACLQEKVTHIEKLKKNTHNPTTLLTTISHTTPKNIVLTNIKIEPACLPQTTGTTNQAKPKNNTQPMTVLLEGTGLSTPSILSFVKKLSAPTSGIANPILTTLVRTPKNKNQAKTQKTYHFTVSGTLEQV
jgi:hypothetical protein